MTKLGRAAPLWNGPSFRGHKWWNGARFQNGLRTNAQQACRWGFKLFICEMRVREYKSTLIDKGLSYSISVKLLILETIVSQRPWCKANDPNFAKSSTPSTKMKSSKIINTDDKNDFKFHWPASRNQPSDTRVCFPNIGLAIDKEPRRMILNYHNVHLKFGTFWNQLSHFCWILDLLSRGYFRSVEFNWFK